MSKKESDWVKASSKNHEGRLYYYNIRTKQSTWELPEGVEDSSIPTLSDKRRGKAVKEKKHGGSEVGDVNGKQRPLQDAWTQSAADKAGETEFAHRNGETGSKKKEEKVQKRNIVTAGPAKTTLEGEECHKDQNKSTTAVMATAFLPSSTAGDEEEAMEVERWGEEEEVAMDIDVSQEDIAEMKLVRRSPLSPEHLRIELFGIPADYSNNFTEKLYLVLDTNVLLSHLNFLEELKDYAIKGVGKPVLVIPWIVMQELDNHKSRGNDRLAGKARKAIRLLFSCFSSNHPRVRCQTMAETQTEIHNVSIANNDDRILHCCLLYQNKTQVNRGIVVLFSNDLNLCSKALGNGVKAADRTSLFKELRLLCQAPHTATPTIPRVPATKPAALKLKIPPVENPTHSHASSFNTMVQTMPSTPVTPYTPMTPFSAPSNISSGCSLVSPAAGLTRTKEVNDIVIEMEGLVKDTLATPLKQEMVTAFDNIWLKLIARPLPWSLKDQLFLLDKHWVAVYGQVLESHVRGVASQLHRFLRNRPGVLSIDEAITFVRSSSSLVQGFKCCTYCVDSVRNTLSQLDQAVEKLGAIKNQSRQQGGGGGFGGGGGGGGGARRSSSLSSPTTPVAHQPPVALVSPMGPTSMSLVQSVGTNLPPISSPALKEKLIHTAQAPPTDQLLLLEWVLGLIHDSIIYSQTLVQEMLDTSDTSANASISPFIGKIAGLLTQIVSSLRSLLERGGTVPHMQEFLCAVDMFLTQALTTNSNLTIDTFYELFAIPEQRELLQRALTTYTDQLAQLQSISITY